MTVQDPSILPAGNRTPGEQPAAEDYAALLARLQPLAALPDGAVHIEPAGIHFHVVVKEQDALRFYLVQQTNPSTHIIQSEIHLDEPLMLQETYSQAMLLSLIWQPEPQRVYMTGLGGGRLALVLHHFYSGVRIDCAETDPDVIRLAERFFGIPQDERLQIAIEDGRVHLARARTKYDVILIDVFLDNGYSPYRMSTVEFFTLCRDRLTPGGALAVNLMANDPYVDRKLESLAAVFPGVWTLATRPFDGDENIIALAAERADLDVATLTARAQVLESRLPYPLAACAAALERHGFSGVAPLRDADPPDDYFATMPSFAAPFSTVKPDLPCPCGSGLRFARCHGRRTADDG